MMNERLLLLATAQECMTDLSDKMDKWDSSQLTIEKSAFDAMNISDHILNMSKDSKNLVVQLQEILQSTSCTNVEDKRKLTALSEELKGKLQNIAVASAEINDVSHKIEGEIANQREIKEGIKNSLTHVRENMDVAVACAEFMFAECDDIEDWP